MQEYDSELIEELERQIEQLETKAANAYDEGYYDALTGLTLN